jgi:phosphohistidine swiveling domain-containing protein
MKVTDNDVGTVTKYSDHRTLESFSNYIQPTEESRIVQALDNVDGILTAEGSVTAFAAIRASKSEAVNRCK